MTANVRIIDQVVRHAPLGLSLWDLARATNQVPGLEVDVGRADGRGGKIRAAVNRSGLYCARGLPGLSGFEFDADRTSALRRYRIEVRDPQGRFLPFAFDADLPASDVYRHFLNLTSPPSALPGSLASPPGMVIAGVPLFSAPSRALSEPLAVIRAELRELASGKPAAWCLLAASIDATVRGIGLADAKGRVAIMFPYPERSRPSLSSPPPAVNDFRWNVELEVHYLPEAEVPEVADLGHVVAQTGASRPLYGAIQSPPQPLPPLLLEYQVPLTARSTEGDGGPSSYLYVGTA